MSTKKPTKIIGIKNPDKKLHEKWTSNRDLFNFPRPFRWLIAGSPNSGKTTLLLNYLLRAEPSYDRIFLLHPKIYNPESDDHTNDNVLLTDPRDDIVPEYKGVKVHHLAYIPTEVFFDGMKGHSLFIIDDIDMLSFTKKDSSKSRRVNKLYSYCSTHNNLSVITTSQSPGTQLPPIAFQLSNIITLFPQRDQFKIRVLSQKLGTDYKELKKYLDQLKGQHDSLTLDQTTGSPMPMRKNVFEPL